MSRHLPINPSLRYLRKEAKDLLKSHRRGDAAACAVLRRHHRFTRASDQDILAAHVSLQEVQHALALNYGLKGWSALKAHVRQAASPRFARKASVPSLKILFQNTGIIHERF